MRFLTGTFLVFVIAECGCSENRTIGAWAAHSSAWAHAHSGFPLAERHIGLGELAEEDIAKTECVGGEVAPDSGLILTPLFAFGRHLSSVRFRSATRDGTDPARVLRLTDESDAGVRVYADRSFVLVLSGTSQLSGTDIAAIAVPFDGGLPLPIINIRVSCSNPPAIDARYYQWRREFRALDSPAADRVGPQ